MTQWSDVKLTREEGEALRGTWVLENVTPDHRSYVMDLGDGKFARKVEHTANDGLLQANHEDMVDSQQKRFGDGRVIARIPLNVFYNQVAPRNGDTDFYKWFLNHEKNRPFRSFRGKV
ncbi:MAG: hypothetical protein GY943_30580 [Chloroflexi bacterium]|nr:hypothetical protein [Chloroflexota bacterium]